MNSMVLKSRYAKWFLRKEMNIDLTMEIKLFLTDGIIQQRIRAKTSMSTIVSEDKKAGVKGT